MVAQINYFLKKIAKFGFGIVFIFYGCPSEDTDCFDLGSTVRVNDLITLAPIQTDYNTGESLTLIVNIPSSNDFYANELSLFESTNDNSALLTLASDELFTDNSLLFIKGSQGEYSNWFNMPYNPDTEMYELEMLITLNRVGQYNLVTDDNAYFQGNDYCNRFRIDTNILWLDPGPGIIEFTVIE